MQALINHTEYIYKFFNETNGKMYIGRTGRPLKYRFQDHMNLLKNGKHTVPEMQKDYNAGHKFGIELLEVIDFPHMTYEESKWMEKFRTYDERYGYNYLDVVMWPIRKAHGLPIPRSKRLGRKFPKSNRDFV